MVYHKHQDGAGLVCPVECEAIAGLIHMCRCWHLFWRVHGHCMPNSSGVRNALYAQLLAQIVKPLGATLLPGTPGLPSSS